MNLLEGHSTDEVKLKSQFGSKSAELVSSFIHLVNIHLVARDLLVDTLIRGQNLKKPTPGGIQTLKLLAMRCVSCSCASTTALLS